MRVLVNALSAESLSGKHVLYGHLLQLARWTALAHEFHVLYNESTRPATLSFGNNVIWHESPPATSSWLKRTVWEATTLPGWINDHAIDLYWTPTGTILPRSPVPQVSLAQNPWCLTSAVRKSFANRCKAMIQRAAYRRAHCQADLMVYNSEYMRRLYRQNAGERLERRGLIAFQGLDHETFASATQDRAALGCRPQTIVCVSVMARWKNCETLLQALRIIRERGLNPRLRLIGPWPDSQYRMEAETLIFQLGLSSCVEIEGHVSRQDLYAAYRNARVFCLLSRCESFGIPAVEAQAFGTPVVGSNTSAMPEIVGTGGEFVDPDDAMAAAVVLERLLTDEAHWTKMSEAAIANSERFRWEECSKPLLEMFSLVSTKSSRTFSSDANRARVEVESLDRILPTRQSAAI